jgi:hypothetical protein
MSRTCLAVLPILLGALPIVSACGGAGLERARNELIACEESRESVQRDLEDCRRRTDESLDLVAERLEGIFLLNPGSGEGSGPPPPSPDGQELSVPLPPPEPATLDRIEELSAATVEVFLELQRRQEDLESQLAAARREARAAHQATQAELAKLQETASGIDTQLGEDNDLRSELARLEADRLRLRLVASGIADTVRTFDAEWVHCRGCGWGFTDRFKRELLTFHVELLRQLDELPSPPRKAP